MATPLTATPIPAYTAIPDVPADMTAAFNNVEKYAIPRFTTTTARDTAITIPAQGQMAYTNDAGLWQYNGTAWVLIPNNAQAARGAIYIGKGGQNATYVTTTETAAIRWSPLNLEAGRHYKVTFTQLSVDTDSGTGASLGSADVRLRIASGTTAGVAGTQIATVRIPVFADDSGKSAGFVCTGTFTVASTGTWSIAACIIQVDAAANGIRLLGANVFLIEDIGPAITEQTITALF
jgi:hypothetical protein